MKFNTTAAAAFVLAATAGSANAQSPDLSAVQQIYAPAPDTSLRIYGILDLPVETLHKSGGMSLNRMLGTGNVPSRFGFAGTENLGNDLQAGFRLESGLNLDTGNVQGSPRFFSREASVSLMSRSWGELRLGRQYSLMQIAMGKYDIDHLSSYSPILAAQQANTEQTSQDNVVGYRSPQIAGFSVMLNRSLGEGAAVVAGPPQVAGAGTAKPSSSALLQYEGTNLMVGVGYLRAGQNFAAGGDATQEMANIGALYKLGAFEFGGQYWQHRNELSNGRTPVTSVWGVGATWAAAPSVKLTFEAGRARDNGMAYATGAAKARGTDTFLTFGGDYSLSRRTLLYTRFGRIADENGGFNGRPALAAVTARDAAPLMANQTVRGLVVGIRHVF